MAAITLCPKELMTNALSNKKSAQNFEETQLFPILELIEACEEAGISLVFSREILGEITEKAPWDAQEENIRSYLNDWYNGIIVPLQKCTNLLTGGAPPEDICDQISDTNIHNHFKDLISQLDTDSTKILGKSLFSIYATNPCPENPKCGNGLLIHGFPKDKENLKKIKYPIYLIYPIELPADGPNPFTPPKNWDKSGSPQRSSADNGYVDRTGRSWCWDKMHNDHWDVQLKNGSHLNIFPNGTER
ncbi:hypothetical protein SAMN02745857_03090 [Andreprevotia lacus DSM 23236]|jgi:hypothetical protein|uniref:Uncharacterized protein n=1 Tax=Andreprevotia lacus DSM 23236 TaxID=1121001 RepID=A0A1W1XVZ9_9NEIS|nr:hypothetical protein [Andreprevotia lacus]SMC28057.1 hypothetical protein SAMN02745857_03090 [Andreprevotia lacus DSM 23236]